MDMKELEELRNGAYENVKIYKDRTKRKHDRKILNKSFSIGMFVLLFNSRLKFFPKKLKSRWSGPFIVEKVLPFGVLELKHPNSQDSFRVNGHKVKQYFPAMHEETKTVEIMYFNDAPI